MLTGWREKKRYLIEVAGQPCWIAQAQFYALCKLVASCVTCDRAATRLPRATVSRLRHSLNEVMPQGGIPANFIWLVAKNKYAMTLAPHQIAIHSSFDKLLLIERADHDLITCLLEGVTRVL
jgi:hypothetical protein